MATGLKANNSIIQDGVSWEDKYGIAGGSLTNATRATLFVTPLGNENGSPALVIYTGSGVLTTSEFNSLPTGSLIFSVADQKVFLKTAATTWKSGAIAT